MNEKVQKDIVKTWVQGRYLKQLGISESDFAIIICYKKIIFNKIKKKKKKLVRLPLFSFNINFTRVVFSCSFTLLGMLSFFIYIFDFCFSFSVY